MHEGDSEPAPLVYDGVIYLINSSNIIQALDGVTGELIWEHHAGPFDSGELDWFFQHVPAEALDLDEVFERVLIDRDDDKLVFSIGSTASYGNTTATAAHSSATRKPCSRMPSPISIR